MKRILSLFLVFTLVFAMVIPAQASSVSEENFVDLLAISSSETNTYMPQADTFTWRLYSPEVMYYKYVDILFYSNVTLTGVYAYFRTSPLNLISLGNGYFRAYGTFDAAAQYFDLIFDFDGNATFLQLISAKASKISQQNFQLSGSWAGYLSIEDGIYRSGTFDGRTEVSVPMAPGGSGAYVSYTYGYQMRFYPGINDAWKAYDKITLTFGFVGYTINSIAAYIDGVDVIESVSFIENGSYTDFRQNIDGEYFFEHSNDWRYVTLTLDLTKIQKTVNAYPIITIEGIYEPGNSSDTLFNIGYCNGVILDNNDSNAFWLRRIYNGLNSLLGSIGDKLELFRTNFFTVMGSLQTNIATWMTDLGNYLGGKLDQLINGSSDQQTSADDFQQSMDDQSQELEDLTGDLSAVNKTPVEDVNVNVSGMVNPDVVILATNGIGGLLSNQIILRVFLMAITLALAGFILYGKR